MIDLALGPARGYAEFAHCASDHSAFLVSIPHRPPQPLPLPKQLPRSGYNEAMQPLRTLFPPPPKGFESREQLDTYAWDVFDVLTGVVGRFAVRPSKHTRGAPWWSEVLATAREIDLAVYRKLCKEAQVNFYREKAAAVTYPGDWGRILRWRLGYRHEHRQLSSAQMGVSLLWLVRHSFNRCAAV